MYDGTPSIELRCNSVLTMTQPVKQFFQIDLYHSDSISVISFAWKIPYPHLYPWVSLLVWLVEVHMILPLLLFVVLSVLVISSSFMYYALVYCLLRLPLLYHVYVHFLLCSRLLSIASTFTISCPHFWSLMSTSTFYYVLVYCLLCLPLLYSVLIYCLHISIYYYILF